MSNSQIYGCFSLSQIVLRIGLRFEIMTSVDADLSPDADLSLSYILKLMYATSLLSVDGPS